jgi:predicted nucleic acid-binding OB-fold protein
MTRHIKSCAIKNGGYKANEAGSDTCFLLHVTDSYNKSYSLHLMVDGCVRLEELDRYLRDIWLECCGHLSHFQINGEYYESYTESSYERGMEDEIIELFYPGLTVAYEYDFGSTTYLSISVDGAFEPAGKERGIRLLARNKPIKYECEKCEKVAEFQYFDPYNGECGIVCSSCKDKMEQENDEIDFSECINSPRSGVCGYDGPADDIPFMPHTPSKRKKHTNKRKNIVSRDSDDALKLMDGLLEGKKIIDAEDVKQIFSGFFAQWLKNRTSDTLFDIPLQKNTERTFSGCLNLLKKDALSLIRKKLSIQSASTLKKQELAECIENHIRENFREILEYMPYEDFRILQNISQEEPCIIHVSDETSFEAMDYLLEMGLIFALEQPLDEYELFFPLKADFLQIVAESEFLKKRELTRQMERCILSVFFYWGVAELEKIVNESARLLHVSADDAFVESSHKIISYMDLVEYEVIGHTRYYYVFSDQPAAQIISNTWQKSEYPALSMDMIPEESGLVGLISHHIHFRLMYELLYELSLEDSIADTDEEPDEEDEEICREEAFCAMSSLVETITNAKPEITAEQLFKELDLPDYFWEQKDFASFFHDLKDHAPNYWIKGNTISGNIYFANEEEYKRLIRPQLPQDTIGNNPIQSAASRWKVGRNDPCPCGSGKKYKKCCLNKVESN